MCSVRSTTLSPSSGPRALLSVMPPPLRIRGIIHRARLLLQCRTFAMTDRPLPLTGIRVLELGQIVAGPFCGTLMAEFGAEVIKTELPGKGDDLRRLGPTEDGCTYWFAVDNRNKKLMTLDLHLLQGQDIVRRLVSHC